MKKYMLVLLSMIASMGMFNSAFSQDPTKDNRFNKANCIEKIWLWTIPTEEEKKFDIANDRDLFGFRFACFADIGATEINDVLNNVKDAIDQNDKAALAHLVVYPFDYWMAVEREGEKTPKSEPRQAFDKSEFIEQYDDIVTPEFKKILSCASIGKFEVLDVATVTIGGDYMTFTKQPNYNRDFDRYFEKYPMRLLSIEPFKQRQQDWIAEHCE